MQMPEVVDDRYPGFSQIRATWEQREKVIAMLQDSEYLKNWFSNPILSGAALKKGEKFELYVLQDKTPKPLAYVFRPNNNAPYGMAVAFQEEFARQVVEAVAPNGTAPLESWLVAWPKDASHRADEYRETLAFSPF
jgi:hypothetical protein